MHNIKKILKSNNGAALVVVLITFLVMSILTLSIIYLNATNTRQVINQKEYYQAYYLAYSGVEIAYSALLMDGGGLLTEFKNNPKTEGPQNISFGEGKIDVTIKSDSTEKITITSTGTLDESGKSVTLTMFFPADYPTLQKWE